MIDLVFMTSVSKYASVPTRSPQTVSFGAHRMSDRPASAVRAGESTMPAAWQTRGVTAYKGNVSRYDAPARSVADIAMDPLRWMVSTRAHRGLTALCAGAVVMLLIF